MRKRTQEVRDLGVVATYADLEAVASAGWDAIEEEHLLDTFESAVGRIPAYRKFLARHGVIPESIRSAADLRRVPPTSKENYLRPYPWEELVAPGALAAQSMVLASTSGSTGEPFYFPRIDAIDEQSSVYHRTFLKRSGLDPKKPTLVVVAFGMGVWIGGIITYEAFNRISKRDFPLTILTAGVNKKEIYDALRNIGPCYQQLVLCGYPPFVKDVVDDGEANGVEWRRFDMRILCAAEGFSEDFRDYLMKGTGIEDAYRGVMNIYGSADLGTIATETSLSILVRRLALNNPSLFFRLFSEATRLPTLAQYIPSFVSFEAVDNRLLCTADNALPLLRYDIGDHGGVLSYDEVVSRCRSEGIDLAQEAKAVGIDDTVCELPFVYVYERADFSTKLYGAIIYPEYVKAGLQRQSVQSEVSGKFKMTTKHDERQDEYLEVNVELQIGVRSSEGLKDRVTDAITESLIEKSAEYHNLYGAVHSKVVPRVLLWPHGDPEHFRPGGKQRWTAKAQGREGE
jgi:phenylacetate-CoA ligase